MCLASGYPQRTVWTSVQGIIAVEPNGYTESSLVRWLILREEVRERTRETAQSIQTRVMRALQLAAKEALGRLKQRPKLPTLLPR
jgi:hypothetical protein